jgi:ribonuclease Z
MKSIVRLSLPQVKITILGSNSALPAFGRNPTAQVVEIDGTWILLDCGEGTQMRMQMYQIPSDKINHVFISHLHGDHYFGLVGLLSSYSLKGRTRALAVYCPKELVAIIQLQLPWELGFPIEYVFLEEGLRQELFSNDKFSLSAFPVYHSVPTHGLRIEEKKRKRKLIPEKLREFEIPNYYYKKLAEGYDYERADGSIILNEWVTQPGPKIKRYAYTADTRYAPEIIEDIKEVDLLFHETTYLKEMEAKAAMRLHSTTLQAATLAHEAKVGRLLIGHFSSKYKNVEPFLTECSNVFPNTTLALEGITFEI